MWCRVTVVKDCSRDLLQISHSNLRGRSKKVYVLLNKEADRTLLHSSYKLYNCSATPNTQNWLWIYFYFLFLAYDICRFCVVIRFFHPRHNGQWLSTSKDFLSQILSIIFIFPSFTLRKSQYFPFQCWVLNKGTTGTISKYAVFEYSEHTVISYWCCQVKYNNEREEFHSKCMSSPNKTVKLWPNGLRQIFLESL